MLILFQVCVDKIEVFSESFWPSITCLQNGMNPSYSSESNIMIVQMITQTVEDNVQTFGKGFQAVVTSNGKEMQTLY